ncbi:hypothetical protein KKA85_07425 [bacterium]|nr:hypothetical protein [bacterium]
MLKACYLVVLIGFVLVGGGCLGDDDDDTTSGDDDTIDDCADVAVPCAGNHDIETESDRVAIMPCESISGDLTFRIQAWLTGTHLPCLTTVGGDLIIENNAALTSLDGLFNLTSVGGDLYIAGNDCLSQTAAEMFAAGLSVGGYADVFDNGANYPCP